METKLCKDCQHYLPATHPLMNGNGQPFYVIPMCAHPDTKRSMVSGELVTPCISARGGCYGGATNDSICWPDAKLFEQKPPPQLTPVFPALPVETDSRPFWRRLFGG